jgi:UDP-glucuronate 4-epimerase
MIQKFTTAIISGDPIKLFNYGKHKRDFTYIDDIIEGIIRVIGQPATINENWDGGNPDPSTSSAPYRVYNIGNNSPLELMDYIEALESELGKIAKKELLPIQPGDVPETFANIDDLILDFNYKPRVKIEDGIKNFVDWYIKYHKIKLDF